MNENSLRKQINASGFPFQIRIADDVRETYHTHGWRLAAIEHRWTSPKSDSDGFIDLIVEKNHNKGLSWFLVVECKRFRGGNWVFMKSDSSPDTTKSHTLWLECKNQNPNKIFWQQDNSSPASHVSSFCAVPGQSDRGTPMLERLSTQLLESIERVAVNQMGIAEKVIGNMPLITKIFAPVLVTNTELILCKFRPEDVNLSAGNLEIDKGDFKTVPYIRFQKNIATLFTTEITPTTLYEENQVNTRTIFIVHAPKLPYFLKYWSVINY